MDGSHHGKEDAHFFPLLRERSPEAAAVLDRLEADHRHGTESVRELRASMARATQGDAQGRASFVAHLRSYAVLLKDHIRTE